MLKPNRACTTCGRQFIHNTHLRRHEATHQGAAHHCQFCGKGFTRRDVARRHAKGCVCRAEGDILYTAKRGRKAAACDRCVSSKRACDGQIPCSRCLDRRLSCIYSRTSSNPFEQSTSSKLISTNKKTSPRSFFYALTDPTLRSASEFLVTEEVHPTSARSRQWDRVRQDRLQTHRSVSNLLFMDFGGSYEGSFLPGWGFPEILNECNLSSFFMDINSTSGNLQARLDLLNSQLKGLIDEKEADKPGTWMLTRTTTYDAFLTETNVLQCASAFFRRWHWQWPIIHWPSFDPDKATLSLLLAVSLTGAAFIRAKDYGHEHQLSPRPCYEIAEIYIFNYLKTVTTPSHPCSNTRDAIQACQAALLINTLQKSVNDSTIRRRIITTRHPVLVATIRRLGLISVKHKYNADTPDWDYFIQTESSIRVVTWTFLADALLSLFCSQPPSMSILEMTGDLPCNEELWDSTTEAEFKNEWLPQLTAWHTPSIRHLVRGLMDDAWTTTSQDCYSRLNLNQLYIVLWALQPNVFGLRSMMLPLSYKAVITRALNRWITIWKDTVEIISISQRQKIGISKYAPELAWLTLKILEITGTEEAFCFLYFQVIASDDTKNLHKFIEAYLPVEGI